MSSKKKAPIKKSNKKVYKEKSLQSLRSSAHWTILNKKNLAAGNKALAYAIKTNLEAQWRAGTRNDIVIGDKVFKFRSVETILAGKFASKHIAGRGNKAGAWEAIQAYRTAVGAPSPSGTKSTKKSKPTPKSTYTSELEALKQAIQESKRLSASQKIMLTKKVSSMRSATKANKVAVQAIKTYLTRAGKPYKTYHTESRRFWNKVKNGAFDPNNPTDLEMFESELEGFEEQERDLDWEEEYSELEEKLRSAGSSAIKASIINEIIKLKSSGQIKKLSAEQQSKIKSREQARRKAYQKSYRSEQARALRNFYKTHPEARRHLMNSYSDAEFERRFGIKKSQVKNE